MAETAITSLPSSFQIAYQENFLHDTQQMESRLKQYVTIVSDLDHGNRAKFDILKKRGNLTRNTERAGKTRVTDQQIEHRWLTAYEYDDAVRIARRDKNKLGKLGDPTSPTLKEMINSVQRTIDREILDALEGSATGGENGDQTIAFKSAQIISRNFTYGATSGQTYTDTVNAGGFGMTVDKIRKVLDMLGTAEVFGLGIARETDNMPVIALSQKDITNLYEDIRVTSGDYNGSLPFSTGRLEEFLGVKFLRTEQLTTGSKTVDAVAHSTRNVLAWVPSALNFYMGDWITDIDVLPDQQHCTQVRVDGRMGGARIFDERVILVQVKA